MTITRYRMVHIGKDHPFSSMVGSGSGMIGFHRLVMAEHLGRPLRSDEIVHHKDGNPLNNSLNNLIVLDDMRHHIAHLRLRAMRYRKLADEFDNEADLIELRVKNNG